MLTINQHCRPAARTRIANAGTVRIDRYSLGVDQLVGNSRDFLSLIGKSRDLGSGIQGTKQRCFDIREGIGIEVTLCRLNHKESLALRTTEPIQKVVPARFVLRCRLMSLLHNGSPAAPARLALL